MKKTRLPKPAAVLPSAIPDPAATVASMKRLAAEDPIAAAHRLLEAYRAEPDGKHAPALADALEATLGRVGMLLRRIEYAMVARN